ncbi:MAG: glycosyltransferase [Armatimonadetes bacterium]|nr:glycosyltransferase [Armatimonadota bacterium]
MILSVVIATLGRNEIERLLDSLEGQNFQDKFEVIIVGEEESLRFKNFSFKVKYLKRLKSGAAAARNAGVENSQGEFILFLDDDLIAEENLFAEHLNFLKDKAVSGVLGDIKNENSSGGIFTDFLIERDLQNSYQGIDAQDVSYDYFYTGNISLRKKVFLASGGFDEDFNVYGYEDLELGYRLNKLGFKIKYNPQAKGTHLLKREFISFCKRKIMLGESAVIFAKKHPELKKEFSLHPPKLKERILINPLTERYFFKKIKLMEEEKDKQKLFPLYEMMLNYYYWQGVKKGLKCL